jgi:hypothetical protein
VTRVAVVRGRGDDQVGAALGDERPNGRGEVAPWVVDHELEAGARAGRLGLLEPPRALALIAAEGDREVDDVMAGVAQREQRRARAHDLVVWVRGEMENGAHTVQ